MMRTDLLKACWNSNWWSIKDWFIKLPMLVDWYHPTELSSTFTSRKQCIICNWYWEPIQFEKRGGESALLILAWLTRVFSSLTDKTKMQRIRTLKVLRVLVLGHGEGVGDLENSIDIQAHQLSGDCGGDRLAAVLDNLENDLL